MLGFVPQVVAEAAKAFDSQQSTREKPKFLANYDTTYNASKPSPTRERGATP